MHVEDERAYKLVRLGRPRLAMRKVASCSGSFLSWNLGPFLARFRKTDRNRLLAALHLSTPTAWT